MSTVLFDNPWDVEGKIEEENVRMKNRHGRLIKRGPCGGKTEETNGTQPLCVRSPHTTIAGKLDFIEM